MLGWAGGRLAPRDRPARPAQRGDHRPGQGGADQDKAAPNSDGLVDYSTDLYIVKPVDMARANGEIIFEINNRGGKQANNGYNDALPTTEHANDPSTAEDFGNGFILREGDTLVWSGSEADVRPGGGRMTIQVP